MTYLTVLAVRKNQVEIKKYISGRQRQGQKNKLREREREREERQESAERKRETQRLLLIHPIAQTTELRHQHRRGRRGRRRESEAKRGGSCSAKRSQ